MFSNSRRPDTFKRQPKKEQGKRAAVHDLIDYCARCSISPAGTVTLTAMWSKKSITPKEVGNADQHDQENDQLLVSDENREEREVEEETEEEGGSPSQTLRLASFVVQSSKR